MGSGANGVRGCKTENDLTIAERNSVKGEVTCEETVEVKLDAEWRNVVGGECISKALSD